MNGRYDYNEKNNKKYVEKKVLENDECVIYKVDKPIFNDEEIKEMNLQSITLFYQQIRKYQNDFIFNKVIEKFDSLGGAVNLLSYELRNYISNECSQNEKNIFKDTMYRYIKQDINRNLKMLKNNLTSLKSSNESKKNFKIKFNIINILKRFEEDLFYGRI